MRRSGSCDGSEEGPKISISYFVALVTLVVRKVTFVSVSVIFFNILNSYPTKDSKYIFDSATYGQIIGGTHTRPRRLLPYKFYKKGLVDNRKRFLPRGGWLDKSHYVANEFLSDKSKLEFKKNRPYLRNKEGIYKIVNLHIHSKELDKYKI